MLTMRKSLQQLNCSVIGLAVLAATSLGSTGVLDGDVAQAVAKKYTNAVVYVETTTLGNQRNQGSGVVVKVQKMRNNRNKYSIVTNEHVVSHANGVKIQVVLPTGEKKEYTNAKVMDLPYERCPEKRATLSSQGKKNANEICYYDLAVIELTTSDKLTVATFAKQLPKVGDAVSAVGYPAQKTRAAVTVKNGKVTYMFAKSGVRFNRINKIGFDAVLEQGMSGGGIFNANGEIVGFNSNSTYPLANKLYQDPITEKNPDQSTIDKYHASSWGMSIRELYRWRPDLFPQGHTIAENSASSITTNKPTNKPTLKTANTQPNTQNKYDSIVEIDVPNEGKISGMISQRGGNTYVVHTVMDKNNLSSFAVRVWNGKKLATVTAKKQPQTSCMNATLYCFTTLNFTSQLNF